MTIALKQTPKTIKSARMNAALYRRNHGFVRQGNYRHRFRQVDVRLEQAEDGEWRMFLNGSEHGLPPTDAEISLWLIVEAIK